MKFRFVALILTILAIAAITRFKEKTTIEPAAPTSPVVAKSPRVTAAPQVVTQPKARPAPAPSKEIAPAQPFESARNGEEDWTPTPEQSVGLEQAMKKEQDWEKRREDFLAGELKLTESDRTRLSELRKETLLAEEALVQSRVENSEGESALREKIKENRQQYDEKVRSILGNARWSSFVSFYGKYWNVAQAERASSHLPLR